MSRHRRQQCSSGRAPNTYVTDMAHFLDTSGELAEMPRPGRRLASFLVLLIGAATEALPACGCDTRIRCRAGGCRGPIQASATNRPASSARKAATTLNTASLKAADVQDVGLLRGLRGGLRLEVDADQFRTRP
jgi:hypothetical protein